MCCLKYEHDQYESARNELPQVGSLVITSMGEGKVVGLDIDKNKVQVQLFEERKTREFSLDDVAESE